MSQSPAFGPDFEIVERRNAYKGFFSLDVLRLRHRLFGGGWSEVLTRELFNMRRAVVVLPYDPMADKVVLVEQFRPGAIDLAEGPWLLEAVAGLAAPDERDEDVARREAREECDLALGRLDRVGRYLSSPGATSEHVDVYVGEVAAPPTGGVFGIAEEGEETRSVVLDFAATVDLYRRGRITAVNAVVPLLHLFQHRDRLRQEWRPQSG